jgi:hypothetical protein
MKKAKRAKYTPDTVNKMLEVIRAGNTHKAAYNSVGVAESTFYEWLNTYPEFKEAVQKAESDSTIELVSLIRKAGDYKWLLERRDPEWNKQDKVDVTSDGKQITFTINLGNTEIKE